MKAATNHRVNKQAPIAAIKADLAALRDDVSNLASADTARSILDDAKGRFQDITTEAKKRAGVYHKQLGEVAGEHPVKTVLISAAAGALAIKLLGWMLRR